MGAIVDEEVAGEPAHVNVGVAGNEVVLHREPPREGFLNIYYILGVEASIVWKRMVDSG